MKLATLAAFILLIACVRTGAAQDSSWNNPDLTSRVEWSQSGNRILVTTRLEGIIILDATTQAVITSIPGSETGAIWYAALSPDATIVATVGETRRVTLWDAGTGQRVHDLEGTIAGSTGIAWSPDGTMLVTASVGVSSVWSVADGEVLFTIPSGGEFPQIAINPQNMLATSWAQNIEIWNLAAQQKVRSLQVPGLRSSIQWSSDSSRLLVSTISLAQEVPVYSIQILNAPTGEVLQEFEGFPDYLTSVQWNPEETQILSTSVDGTVRITDTASGETSTILESNAPVLSADWSPYGGQIAVGKAPGSTANPEGDTVQMLANNEHALAVLVPAPSLGRLHAIADACNAPTPTEQLDSYLTQLERLPANTIPSACAADLVAVAEALQRQ